MPDDDLNTGISSSSSPDEASELQALGRALKLSKGFSLIFARCNQAEHRMRLIASLRSDLPDLRVQEIPVFKPERHLLNALRPLVAEPAPDAVFVYGIEAWFTETENPKSSPFIANLNAARNHFPGVVPCPLVLWVPEHILTAIARGAPDFFSVRSGIYSFAAESNVRSAMAESLTGTAYTAVLGLPFKEKLERIGTLERMLREYQKLPEEQRDLAAEARILYSLGDLNFALGDYSVAEPCFQQSLVIQKNIFGIEDPHSAETLNALAVLYYNQREFAKAERLLLSALTIREKALGCDHPDTAATLNNLAWLYYNKEEYAKAEPLYKRALAIWEKALGPEHSDTAQSLNKLAHLYRKQRNYATAESLSQRALAIREKTLGAEHPFTAYSLDGLAMLYYDLGNYAAAESLHRRALAIREKILGPEHPDTGTSLENYALLLRVTGRSDEAKAMEARAQTIRAAHAAKNSAE